eukprot:gene11298-13348_t
MNKLTVTAVCDGMGLLTEALIAGRPAEEVVRLINPANANEILTQGFTPLHLAAGGIKDFVGVVLSNGAQVNVADKGNATPQGSKEVAEVLLSNGAQVDARQMDNLTPLHLAARGGFKEVLEVLLSNGAQVNATDKGDRGDRGVRMRDSFTPLHLAARVGV